MFDEYERYRTFLRRWIWKRCPFCNSDAQPKILQGGIGGYQEEIVLQCPQCSKSIKFTTDWSPVIDFPLVNEYSGEIHGKVCPYLSIQKKGDNDYLLRCCSRRPDECFGKDPENCDSFHFTKINTAKSSSY